jgi:hypothetical protein
LQFESLLYIAIRASSFHCFPLSPASHFPLFSQSFFLHTCNSVSLLYLISVLPVVLFFITLVNPSPLSLSILNLFLRSFVHFRFPLPVLFINVNSLFLFFYVFFFELQAQFYTPLEGLNVLPTVPDVIPLQLEYQFTQGLNCTASLSLFLLLLSFLSVSFMCLCFSHAQNQVM